MAQKTLKITYTETDDELYLKYAGEFQAQRVNLTLNLDTGTLSADSWCNIGGGQSARSFNGRDQEWIIPPLKTKAFQQFVDAHRNDFQTLLDDHEVGCDGGVELGDQGRDAHGRIETAIEQGWDPSDIWEPWDASDYFSGASLEEMELGPLSTIADIEEVADREIMNAPEECVLDRDDVVAYLTDEVEQAKEDVIDEAECSVDAETVEVVDRRKWQTDIIVSVTVTIGNDVRNGTVYLTVGAPDAMIGTAEASGYVPSEVWASGPLDAWAGDLANLVDTWGEELDLAALVTGEAERILDEILERI